MNYNMTPTTSWWKNPAKIGSCCCCCCAGAQKQQLIYSTTRTLSARLSTIQQRPLLWTMLGWDGMGRDDAMVMTMLENFVVVVVVKLVDWLSVLAWYDGMCSMSQKRCLAAPPSQLSTMMTRVAGSNFLFLFLFLIFFSVRFWHYF